MEMVMNEGHRWCCVKLNFPNSIIRMRLKRSMQKTVLEGEMSAIRDLKKKKKDQNIHKHVGTQHWNSRWGSVLRIAQEWYSTFLPLQAQSLSCFCQEQGLGDWKPGSQKPLENRPASLLPGTSELTQGDVGLWEMLEDFRLEKTHGVTCLDRETVNRHSPLSYRFNAVSTAWHPALLMSRRLTAAMVK